MWSGEGMQQKSFQTAGHPSPCALCHPLCPRRGSCSYGHAMEGGHIWCFEMEKLTEGRICMDRKGSPADLPAM